MSLVLAGPVAGVFALVGGKIMGVVLGSAYGGGVGRELGHLVVYLALWMLAWVGFAVTFPLVFVAEKRWTLVPLAVLGFVHLHPDRARPARAVGPRGSGGRARPRGVRDRGGPDRDALVAHARGSPPSASRGSSLVVGGATALAFGVLSLFLAPIPAALLGVVVYAAIVYALRSLGLSEAWTYVRGLH